MADNNGWLAYTVKEHAEQLGNIWTKVSAMDVRLGKVEVKVTIIATIAGFVGSLAGQFLFSVVRTIAGK